MIETENMSKEQTFFKINSESYKKVNLSIFLILKIRMSKLSF